MRISADNPYPVAPLQTCIKASIQKHLVFPEKKIYSYNTELGKHRKINLENKGLDHFLLCEQIAANLLREILGNYQTP